MKTTILQKIPKQPGTSEQYLFYLHGLIVEEAGIRPKSEEHGYYEYELILQGLAGEGFTVISEAREKGTQVIEYAEKIVSEIRHLMANNVAANRISVVGASKGGIIAAYVSNILQQRDINYVFLSGLFEKCLVDENLKLCGRVLSIHDRADKLSMTPELYFKRSSGMGEFKAIVLDLDVGHGLIYQPFKEWLEPLVEWLSPT